MNAPDLNQLLHELGSPVPITVQNAQGRAIGLMATDRYLEVWYFLTKQYKILRERQDFRSASSHILLYNLKTLIANIVRKEMAALLNDPHMELDELEAVAVMFNGTRSKRVQRITDLGVYGEKQSVLPG